MASNYAFPKTIADKVLLWFHGRRLGLFGDGQSTNNTSLVIGDGGGVTVGSVRTGANSLKVLANGLASAGAVTVAGTLVGDTVELVLDLNSAAVDVTADFESTVSVAGQVQQTGGSLSGHPCLFFVNPQAPA